MFSQAKAQALIRDLSDKLSKRLAFSGTSVNTITQANSAADAAGAVWPYLLISQNGNVAEGQPVIYVKIAGVDAVSKDIFGNDTDSYAPHILTLAYELGSAGNETLPSHADIAAVTYESIMTGVRFQLKEIANGTSGGVSDANVTSASVVADLDDLYWPTKKV